MGLFKFLKDKFGKKKEANNLENPAESKQNSENEVKKYDSGLAKSRENFSNRIKVLNKKFKSKKIDEDYFNDDEVSIARYIASQCALAIERHNIYNKMRVMIG